MQGASLLLAGSTGEPLNAAARGRVNATLLECFRENYPDERIATVLQGLGYGPQPARTIAAVEVRLTQGYGGLCGACTVGMRGKRWLVSNDPGICPDCTANKDQDWIAIEEPFVSGLCARSIMWDVDATPSIADDSGRT